MFQIAETDIVSKKICQKCNRNIQKIYEIREAALQQDLTLKKKCQQYLSGKGIRLPNTSVTIKQRAHSPENDVKQIIQQPQEYLIPPRSSKRVHGLKGIHQSVIDVYRRYPNFKLPKKCLMRHVAPIVSLKMGEVESYFRRHNLEMSMYIYKPKFREHRSNKRETKVLVSCHSKKNIVALSLGKQTELTQEEISLDVSESEKPISDAVENQTNQSVPSGEDNAEEIHLTNSAKRKAVESNNISDSPKLKKIVKRAYSDSAEVELSQKEETSLPYASKPEFIQSLGLTPAIVSRGFQNILVCKICHNRQSCVANLKKHLSRHRICPFCKLKFKSAEKKQSHVDQNCEVRQIMESSGAYVSLEKADLNPVLRKQYKKAFGELSKDEIGTTIVVSDDDSNGANADVEQLPNETSSQKFESCSVLHPIVSIHNNSTLDSIKQNVTDKQLIAELILLLGGGKSHSKSDKRQKMVQTLPPRNQDVLVNRGLKKCKLRNFKGNLLSYMVPVSMSNGDFNISYEPYTEPKRSKVTGDWSKLPLVEKQALSESPNIPLVNATYPLAFVTSQVQSLSSIQLMTATPTMSIFLPNTSTFIPNSGISLQPSVNSAVTQTQAISNTFFSSLSSAPIQTAPLLQNYTVSMTPLPIINNQVPIQSTSTASPVLPSNPTTLTVKEDSEASSSKAVYSSEQKGKGCKKLSLSASKSFSKKTNRQIIKVKIGNVAGSSKSSKVRVKNIWELK